jgi:hypothetical protein
LSATCCGDSKALFCTSLSGTLWSDPNPLRVCIDWLRAFEPAHAPPLHKEFLVLVCPFSMFSSEKSCSALHQHFAEILFSQGCADFHPGNTCWCLAAQKVHHPTPHRQQTQNRQCNPHPWLLLTNEPLCMTLLKSDVSSDDTHDKNVGRENLKKPSSCFMLRSCDVLVENFSHVTTAINPLISMCEQNWGHEQNIEKTNGAKLCTPECRKTNLSIPFVVPT